MSAKLKRGHPNGGNNCMWGGLNEGAVAENWRLSTRNVVNYCFNLLIYKLSVMTYSCLHGQAPQYLLDVCQPVSDVTSRHGVISDLLVGDC